MGASGIKQLLVLGVRMRSGVRGRDGLPSTQLATIDKCASTGNGNDVMQKSIVCEEEEKDSVDGNGKEKWQRVWALNPTTGTGLWPRFSCAPGAACFPVGQGG